LDIVALDISVVRKIVKTYPRAVIFIAVSKFSGAPSCPSCVPNKNVIASNRNFAYRRRNYRGYATLYRWISKYIWDLRKII